MWNNLEILQLWCHTPTWSYPLPPPRPFKELQTHIIMENYMVTKLIYPASHIPTTMSLFWLYAAEGAQIYIVQYR